MKYYFITFRSVTTAQRAEKELQGEGVRTLLVRTPKWMEAQGCGYSLRLKTGEISAAADLLQERHIPFRRIYVQDGDGNLEELGK